MVEVVQQAETLAGIALLRDLSARDLENLGKRCQWRRYRAQQQIIGHQEQSRDVSFVVRGEVRAIVYSLAGKEVTFRDIKAGETFGDFAAIDGRPRSANVVALTGCVIASMSANLFWDVLREHPAVAETLLKQLVGLVRQLSERVFEFSTLAVKNRIHAELLRLARDHMVSGDTALISPVPTHAEIASRVSTHREAVTRELNELDRAGLIERRGGKLAVRDVDRLARMVQEVLGDSF